MAKKTLDHDDIHLWKKVTDTVTPISREDWIIPDMVIASPVKPAVTPKVKTASSSQTSTSSPPVVAVPKRLPSLLPADLDRQGYGGISRAAARSMKSGQSGYTKRIDLHGATLPQAHEKLKSFLLSAATEGHRHVLVITGKGTANKGVIRSHLPVWLNEPPLSAHVIAYCQAQIKDGGAGAWYVNLRRRR